MLLNTIKAWWRRAIYPPTPLPPETVRTRKRYIESAACVGSNQAPVSMFDDEGAPATHDRCIQCGRAVRIVNGLLVRHGYKRAPV